MRSVEIRVLRATRGTWLHAGVFASIALALTLFAAMRSMFDTGLLLWLEGHLALTSAYAIPVVLLLPFVLTAALWRRWRGAARYWPAAAVAVYGIWAVPLTVRAIASIPEVRLQEALDREATRPARLAMRVPPEVAARRAVAAGNTSFLFVMGFAAYAPGLENPCVIARFGAQVIVGTSDGHASPGHLVFQHRAVDYALRYNAELAKRLAVPSSELARDGDCATQPGIRWWPAPPPGY